MMIPSDCLQDYMGEGAQPKQLVQEFIRAQGRSFAAPGNRQVATGTVGDVFVLQLSPCH